MADSVKVIAKNKKARHDYFIEETYECGIVLAGTEVKSLRQGKASLKESHADIKDGEVYVYQMNITPYEHGNIYNKDPLRPRKLLLHKQQIRKLIGLKQREGYMINGTPSQSGTLTGVSRKICGTAFSFQKYPNGDVKVSTGMLKLE